jgi:hypothetical protein
MCNTRTVKIPITHSQYRCTTAYIRSSNHPLILHSPTSNSRGSLLQTLRNILADESMGLKLNSLALVRSELYRPSDRRLSAKLVPTFADRRCRAWSTQRISTAVNLHFLDPELAPQLFSRGWVDPVPDPLLLRKSGSAVNRTRDLWICSQELWLLDHRGDRRWACRLQLLLVLASAVILRSESRGTHDYILLSQIRDYPNQEARSSLCPRITMAQFYPQALGSISVAFYDSRGYGGSNSNPPPQPGGPLCYALAHKLYEHNTADFCVHSSEVNRFTKCTFFFPSYHCPWCYVTEDNRD